tara:strand:+ start:311 stop:754 length:444 start_codon:yes stop_codon:yes gene_type:complete
MNTNKTVLSIVDKLKPAKEAVKLSALSDIEDNLDRFQYAEDDASWLAYEWVDMIIDAFDRVKSEHNLDDFIINGNVRDLNEVTEIMRNALQDLEVKSEELGIDPSDVFADYEDLKSRVDRAEQLEQDAIEANRLLTDKLGYYNNFWE